MVGRNHIGGASGHKAYKKLQGQVGVLRLDLGVRLPERERESSVHKQKAVECDCAGNNPRHSQVVDMSRVA